MIIKYEHSLVVCKTKAGHYKVYVMGRADGHVIDWRGCNYKFVPVTQPHRGFSTKEEAEAYMKQVDSDSIVLEYETTRAKSMAGQSIPDDRIC